MIGNDITLVGNLVQNPELRYTAGGSAAMSLSVAYNRTWTNKTSGEKEEAVSFFRIQAWGTLAENVAETLQKGDRIIVNGRLEQRTWEDTDGTKKSSVEIVADDIAPSLRYASATVTRNERVERSDGASAPRAAAKPKAKPAAASYGYDDTDDTPF